MSVSSDHNLLITGTDHQATSLLYSWVDSCRESLGTISTRSISCQDGRDSTQSRNRIIVVGRVRKIKKNTVHRDRVFRIEMTRTKNTWQARGQTRKDWVELLSFQQWCSIEPISLSNLICISFRLVFACSSRSSPVSALNHSSRWFFISAVIRAIEGSKAP